MASEQAGPTRNRRVFRQRGPVAMAVLFGVVAAFLLVSVVSAWDTDPEPAFLAWVLFAIVGIWALFVRPAVVLQQRGVRLCNIVRDVEIPWPLVQEVDHRWNVKVWSGDRAYTAWAISSKAPRPSARAQLLGLTPGRPDPPRPADGPAAPRGVNASVVAEAIRATRWEYEDAVERGDLAPELDPQVRVGWVPVSLVLLGATLVAALLLTVA
ncbi:MAG TPA: hypothetical protein VFJ97_12230 [Dermatophilaceae bacterium]|nr:hypothetical protein [Dermatophilaceae bacterium]